MNYLSHFQRYKFNYEIIVLFCYFFINATVLATSVLMEESRESSSLVFDTREPFVWEYSSAVSSILLFPLIVYLLRKHPFQWQNIKQSFAVYGFASVVFSLGHVGLMVGIREVVYLLMDRRYDFGNLGFELLYEYRKDLWSFIFFVIVIKGYQFIIMRLQGEANPIEIGESEHSVDKPHTNLDRLLVKKLGKEFIIQIHDVEWLEGSGNYVNLHIKERIYPLRATLTSLSAQLSTQGFCRIHRSHAVRLDMVESITPLASGDSEVKLRNNKTLMLSRRYKDGFKQMFER
ncbi:LytR/AlgR family response regulator transcription factor [Shewanella sp. OMA3-2]|uniref:LytR/AlgR family response regulator transcription factor n=1 Tax=Shewanella sp. OMA3-2 TaxID=2908650 RepID=UPI001F233295|nr:LytTR family DNA-binding domain-containing protein [Shewanella sp. OMA3-2]UJF21950.1 LytTR family transcriptional regulator [Shewanella sp. OMA3-2]